MTQYELSSICLSLLAFIVIAGQLVILIRSFKADHERRQKQSTIEYVNQIRHIYQPIDRKLREKYRDKALNPEDVDDGDLGDIREMLSVLENLAVGVNTGVYNLALVNRMMGTAIVKINDNTKPYIRHARINRGSATLYEEFDGMSSQINSLRNQLPDKGDIVYSKQNNA